MSIPLLLLLHSSFNVSPIELLRYSHLAIIYEPRWTSISFTFEDPIIRFLIKMTSINVIWIMLFTYLCNWVILQVQYLSIIYLFTSYVLTFYYLMLLLRCVCKVLLSPYNLTNSNEIILSIYDTLLGFNGVFYYWLSIIPVLSVVMGTST